MKLFEYCQMSNLVQMTADQRLFVSKLILKEVNKYAKKNNMSPEDAYFKFQYGLCEEALQELPDYTADSIVDYE